MSTQHQDTQAVNSELAIGLGGLAALDAMLRCMDPEKWNSMGRPSASDLGMLVTLINHQIVDGLETLGVLPPLM